MPFYIKFKNNSLFSFNHLSISFLMIIILKFSSTDSSNHFQRIIYPKTHLQPQTQKNSSQQTTIFILLSTQKLLNQNWSFPTLNHGITILCPKDSFLISNNSSTSLTKLMKTTNKPKSKNRLINLDLWDRLHPKERKITTQTNLDREGGLEVNF